VGLRISTNLLSLNVQRNLATTTRALQRSMQRLSSGNRINTGRDDPAGLAMASGLEAQRRGLLQAVRNMNDARGFLETADGAMSTQLQMVQRMRELSVQASNGTLNDSTRGYLNNEFQSLLAEFNRVTIQTQFNGLNLLDGSFATKALQVGVMKGQSIDMGLTSMTMALVFPTGSVTTTSTSTTVGLGTFSTRRTLAPGSGGDFSNPGVASGDFNGDGKQDLLAQDFTNDYTMFWLGNGNGTFALTKTFAGRSNAVISGDLNGDGKLDFIATDYPGGTGDTGIYLGNGNGTFQAVITTTFSPGAEDPDRLVLVDLNGDGKLDFLVGEDNTNQVQVALGNGNGTFQSRTVLITGYSASAHPWDIQSADLNGDGKADMVVADHSDGSFSVFLGNGNGTFLPRVTYEEVNSEVNSVQLADVNGDGKIDIIDTIDPPDPDLIGIRLGNGNGTFQSRSTLNMGSATPYSVKVADLNGDSKLDMVVALQNLPGYGIILGNGNGTFAAVQTHSFSTSPDHVDLRDLNGDGVLDFVILDGGSTSTLSIFFQDTSSSQISVTVDSSIPFDISTQTHAQDILNVLDSAVNYINLARAKVGGLQSRLDFAENNAQNSIENISAARSQIMDTDLAAETAEFARLQILQKAGIAVLGQANLTAQMSLKLLEGV
jgi:flagellin-like hook-associated protein FlgL